MKVTVVLDCDSDFEPAARYTLATLLGMTGLPFEFASTADTAGPNGLILFYGGGEACPSDADVTILAGEGYGHIDELCVEQTERGTLVSSDLIAAVFLLLTDFETESNASERPWVNAYAWLVSEWLVQAARRKGLALLRIWPWPQGRRHAVVLSHDVDQAELHNPANGLLILKKAARSGEARGLVRGLFYSVSGLWGKLVRRGPDPAWHFERFMNLEAENGFRSSFYFVPAITSAGRDPAYDVGSSKLQAITRKLRNGGWEIGVHGSFHSSRDALQALRERRRLEEVLGGTVTGIRQHYLRFGGLDTFRVQAEAGYAYDTTLGCTERVGFRGGIACPFHPFDHQQGKPLSLLELPLTAMDGALFWHLGCNTDEAVERILTLLQLGREHYGLTVLLWHQRVGDERRYPGWWQAYEQIVHHLRATGDAWVATGDEVTRWWLARERIRVDAGVHTPDRMGWSLSVPQDIEGLVFQVTTRDAPGFTVEGAQAEIEAGEGGRTWIRLAPLTAGQEFEVIIG